MVQVPDPVPIPVPLPVPDQTWSRFWSNHISGPSLGPGPVIFLVLALVPVKKLVLSYSGVCSGVCTPKGVQREIRMGFSIVFFSVCHRFKWVETGQTSGRSQGTRRRGIMVLQAWKACLGLPSPSASLDLDQWRCSSYSGIRKRTCAIPVTRIRGSGGCDEAGALGSPELHK